MFVAEALFDFSRATLTQQQTQKQQQQQSQKEAVAREQQYKGESDDSRKRQRSNSLDRQEKLQNHQQSNQQQHGHQNDQISYLSFQKTDKILVEQAYENGWWYGHVIKQPKDKGFFPSNYVKVGAKPPPPPLSKNQQQQSQSQQQNQQDQEEHEEQVYDYKADEQLNEQLEELGQTEKGAVNSAYYHGITGYKYVKINENNKGVLNGNYVKYDVATGLARVPVKDQAPCAKAVRQMGYYFDYHQWNEQRNRNPEAYRNRPDPRKKNKKKKLRLLGMGKDA